MIAYAPDPAPNTGNRPITYAPFVYVTRGEYGLTHRLIPGVWFRCYLPANGRRVCVEFREPENA